MDEGHHRVRRLVGGIAVLGIAAGLVAGGYALGYDNGRESAQADAEAVPSPVETITAETSGGGDPVAEGEQVFASVACGSCHVLQAAGTAGQTGPSLDETKPSRETVIAVVTNGRGGMPPFSHLLEPEQIAAVAAYVSTVAGR